MFLQSAIKIVDRDADKTLVICRMKTNQDDDINAVRYHNAVVSCNAGRSYKAAVSGEMFYKVV